MGRFVLAALVLTTAGLGITGWIFRAEAMLAFALITAHAPDDKFDAAQAPPAPDYERAANWTATPEISNDPSDVAPLNVALSDPATAPVDVFFIHPTSFFSSKMWNASLDDAETNRRTDLGTIRNQASVFNGCCRVYAPRYRQVTFSAFVTRDRATDVRQALDLAYADVLAAFDFYIRNRNAKRPFIIASHSQGSRHAIRLLKDRIEGSPLRQQLVAAYIIGAAVPEDATKRLFPSIAVCTSALETGCLVAFATFREGADSSVFQDRAEIAYPTGFERTAGKPLICVNPLDWKTGGAAAPATANLGAWGYGQGPKPRAASPQVTGARCGNGNGTLYISDPDDIFFRRLVMPVGNYHNYDYQLFYMNIRSNAAQRAEAFLSRKNSQQ
jgi:hypothetical protein